MTVPAPATALRPSPPATPDAEVAVHGERWLRAADRWLGALDQASARYLPRPLNPLLQLGAVANACFLIAVATGVLLLLWYVPSVHGAYGSMQAMDAAPFGSGLVRSLHRYSSDACMALVLLHAVKIFAARRFTGARWLAWVTGVLALALLWLVGWLGYWLSWDERAQQVAQGTARGLDVLPIFADPLSRSFLSDATLSSLLFFVVFFAHMLLPLAMGIALWLHIARLARARFLPGRALSGLVLATLLGLSVLQPASVAAPAAMGVMPERFTMDWWYLAPLGLTDRLSGGALWALTLAGGLAILAVPRWMARGRLRAAEVVTGRCNACTRCVQDCPYAAITMVPRTDGKPVPGQAQVDPARCIGCGICAGSCDSSGIGLPWIAVVDERHRLDRWLEEEPGVEIAFACAHSAGGALTVDPESGRCAELPGFRVLRLPCAGWLHMLTVERVQRRGAGGVVIVACGEGSCRYREGTAWTQARLDGAREPRLRLDRADRGRIVLLRLAAGERQRLAALAAGLVAAPRRPGRVRRVLAGAGLAAALSLLTLWPSDLGYATPGPRDPELVVSFKHGGVLSELGRVLTAEEKARLPVHMRRERVVERTRSPVRLRVVVDGHELLTREYRARGLWADGPSLAVERFPLTPGSHRVEVAIGETRDAAEWTYRAAHELDFAVGRRRVVLFEKVTGFRVE